eukprot:scaffold6979_cov60-Phaeocystis_antarctica.AAC.1
MKVNVPAGQLMSRSARLPDASSPCRKTRGALGRMMPSLARSCIWHPRRMGALREHERRKRGQPIDWCDSKAHPRVSIDRQRRPVLPVGQQKPVGALRPLEPDLRLLGAVGFVAAEGLAVLDTTFDARTAVDAGCVAGSVCRHTDASFDIACPIVKVYAMCDYDVFGQPRHLHRQLVGRVLDDDHPGRAIVHLRRSRPMVVGM